MFVLGLSVVRTHAGLSFAADPFASARDAAREILRANPKMFARDVVAWVLESTGETITSFNIETAQPVEAIWGKAAREASNGWSAGS